MWRQATRGELRELRELVQSGAIPYRIAGVLLEELQGPSPTLLVLEDLHWADEATLDVFQLVARRMEKVPALLVATYRDDELDASHPLRVVLSGLAGPTIQRIHLSPLSPAAVALLAGPHSVGAEDLYRMTSDNPSFVTEVLAGDKQQIPETVRDAVVARVSGRRSRLGPELGRTSPSRGDFDRSFRDRELAPRGAHRAARQGARGVPQPGDARLGTRDRLLSARARAVDGRGVAHASATACVAPQGSRRPGGSARWRAGLRGLAHHADAAADREAVLRFAPEAAARAASLGARREAAEHYARALRFADGLTPHEVARLQTLRSTECYLTDQSDEAIDALRRAVSIFRDAGNPLRQGEAMIDLADKLWCPGRGPRGQAGRRRGCRTPGAATSEL